MELAELKLISASNLIKLRTEAGMTQAELGAKLNYSDKTISKWERGEAIPDAYVLKQLSEIFNVSVDFLLSSHDSWEERKLIREESPSKYRANVIIAIVIIGIMTLALTVFVTMWIMDIIEWRVFLAGLIISLLAYMVLDCTLKKGRYLPYTISAFILSLITGIYFFLPHLHLWQIYILAVPAIIIVFLSCNVRRKPKKQPEASSEG